jgi:hypothetical protein
MPFTFCQLELDLFAPPTFADVLSQMQVTSISVTVSPRLKKGWYLKFHRTSTERQLIVPKYLEAAPLKIKEALIKWSLFAYRNKKNLDKNTLLARKLLEREILDYIEALHPQTSRSGKVINPNEIEQNTRGVKYDLREQFAYVNILYFNGTLSSLVKWGERGSLTSYQTFRYDTQGTRFSVITIAGVYNHPATPVFAVQAVLYHEMLPIAIPPTIIDGRRQVHSRDFRLAEKKFKYFKEWRDWEAKNVRKLSRSLKRKK